MASGTSYQEAQSKRKLMKKTLNEVFYQKRLLLNLYVIVWVNAFKI